MSLAKIQKWRCICNIFTLLCMIYTQLSQQNQLIVQSYYTCIRNSIIEYLLCTYHAVQESSFGTKYYVRLNCSYLLSVSFHCDFSRGGLQITNQSNHEPIDVVTCSHHISAIITLVALVFSSIPSVPSCPCHLAGISCHGSGRKRDFLTEIFVLFVPAIQLG